MLYDSVNPYGIPSNATAFAGYINGKPEWRSYQEMVRRFPHLVAMQRDLSISVTASELAKCLDVEKGDASPSQAGEWVKWALEVGIWRPCLYANLVTMPAVIADLHDKHIQRKDIRLWVAHYDHIERVPAGYDAKQFTNGPLYDTSEYLPSFFPAVTPVTHIVRNPRFSVNFQGEYNPDTGKWRVLASQVQGLPFAS